MNHLWRFRFFGLTSGIVIVVLVLATGLVWAQREPTLAEWALQADDLKALAGGSGLNLIKSGPSSATDSTQPLSNINELLHGGLEYKEAYAVAATLQDDIHQVGAFVGNYLYRYADPSAAHLAADRLIGTVLEQHGARPLDLTVSGKVVKGQAVLFTSAEGDVTYLLTRTRDNVLILGLVNGGPTAFVQRTFDALAALIVSE